MACREVTVFWAVCGHGNVKMEHSDACRNPPDRIRDYRQIVTSGKCWNPLPLRRNIPEYLVSECGQANCRHPGTKKSPEEIQNMRKIWQSRQEHYESEHRFDTREAVRLEREIETRCLLSYAKVLNDRKAELLPIPGHVQIEIIDLTLPRREILKSFLGTVDNPPDGECSLCFHNLRDGPIGVDGEYLSDGIPGVGIVRQPPCGHLFHDVCLIKRWVRVETEAWSDTQGEPCPGCAKDLKVRFGIFNGGKKPHFKYFPRKQGQDVSRGWLVVGGYVEFTWSLSHLRHHYMDIKPFRTAPDRWGYLPDGKFADEYP